MSVVNYGDLTGSKIPNTDKVSLHNGYNLVTRTGYAKITDTLQSNIPVYLPSEAQSREELTNHPDIRLEVPAKAIINRIALRLPERNTDTMNAQFGKLASTATLIGTTDELVKVAVDGDFGTTDPAIVCVDDAYAPNSSVAVNRPIDNPADVATSNLIVVGEDPLLISVVVSDAGNAGAGIGIKTSSGVALAIVEVSWLEIANAPTYETMGYLNNR